VLVATTHGLSAQYSVVSASFFFFFPLEHVNLLQDCLFAQHAAPSASLALVEGLYLEAPQLCVPYLHLVTSFSQQVPLSCVQPVPVQLGLQAVPLQYRFAALLTFFMPSGHVMVLHFAWAVQHVAESSPFVPCFPVVLIVFAAQATPALLHKVASSTQQVATSVVQPTPVHEVVHVSVAQGVVAFLSMCFMPAGHLIVEHIAWAVQQRRSVAPRTSSFLESLNLFALH
jgi:hypothetical protein